MIALALTALFTISATVIGLSLLDSWLRGRSEFAALRREQMLLKAGFVPQVQASQVRLRRPARRTLAAATRPYARRLPLPTVQIAA